MDTIDSPERSTVKHGGGEKSTKQFLTFWLNTEIYAIDILNIKEIIGFCSITRVPMMSGVIAGVINLRGNVVPVVTLSKRFGQEPQDKSKRTSIIIVGVENGGCSTEIGIVVDEVSEVIDIAAINIEPPPSFGTKIRTDFIEGMGKCDNKLLSILDLENVLSVNELSLVE